jgi:hypothetical protein
VIGGREGAIRARDFPAVRPQLIERLRRCHFMDEVQADEELRLAARQLPDGVEVPHFLQECLSHR